MREQELFDQAQGLRNNGQIDEAVNLYQQARAKALEGSWLSAECLHMIGVAYYQDKRYKEAGDFLKQAEEEFKTLNNSDLVAAVLRDLASVARGQKDFIKARKFLQKSIDLLKTSNKIGHLGISQVKLGVVLSEEGELEEAEDQILIGLKNIQKSPERFFEAISLVNLAEVQRKIGKEDEAKKSAERSLQILSELGDDKNQALKSQIKDFLEN